MHLKHVRVGLIHHVLVYPILEQQYFDEDKSKEHWHNIYRRQVLAYIILKAIELSKHTFLQGGHDHLVLQYSATVYL